MTLPEFDLEFDLLYNNLTSGGAPPLDKYEKSVLLTQSQERLVRSYYDAFKNVSKEGFEGNEERRRELVALVKDSINTTPVVDARQLSANSRFFALANDVMYVIYEEAILTSNDVCLEGKNCSVIPTKHDEFRKTIKNPFKKPSESKVLRLDSQGTQLIELISVDNSTVSSYKYRYVKYPAPIVLETLTGGLSINGITATTNSELATSAHRKIIDGAVQLALEATGNPRIQTKTQIDNKPEY